MTGHWVAHDDALETEAEDESFNQVDPLARVTLRLKRPPDNPLDRPAKAARRRRCFTQVHELDSVRVDGKTRKREEANAAPKKAVPKKVPVAQLSDDEVERQLKQEGLSVPKSNNKSGIFGVYEVQVGGFVVKITRAVEGGPPKQMYLGFSRTRMQAALCAARTPEGQAVAAAAAAAAARGVAHPIRSRLTQRWDAGTCGAGQEEERAVAKKAHEGRREMQREAQAERREARRKEKAGRLLARREVQRVAQAERREARRKEKVGRLLAYCNAMKQHAANKVQRRKRHEAQAEKRERREDAERAIDTAQAQLDAAEDAQLDDATRTALELFALGDKDSAKAALPRLLRIKVCQVYALDHQRSLFAKTKRERAANGAVDPPDPEGVAPVLNPARPWASACHAVLSSHLVTMLSPCHPTPPRLTPTPTPSSPPLAQPTAARRRSSTQRSAGSLRGART